MRRTVSLVVAVAAGAIPAAGGTAGAPSALVVGDSLAQGMRPYLSQQLPGWRVTHVVRVGFHTADGVERVRALGRGLPRYVVLSLGTNDDPRNISGFHAAVRAVLRTAGTRRCVVWPNIARRSAAGTTYAGFNRALAAEARSSPNLRVVDWVGMTRRHPAWIRADGVHATAAGYRARAAAVARALAACPA
jgi:lysophospholipase L1-like esterase